MAAKPSGKATARRKGVIQPHGGMLVPGAGGGRENGLLGGRPPDEFKRRMRELASSDKALAFLEECVNGLHGPQFAIKAQEYAAERGYGKEAQPVVGDESKPLVIRVVKG